MDFMKILQVYHIYPAVFGGVSKVVYDIVKELSRKGYDIVIFTTNAYLDKKFLGSYELNDGVKIYHFPAILRNFIGNVAIADHTFISYVKRMIRTFDVIHLHGYRTFQNVIVHYYAKKYKVPFILQAHGSLPRIMGKQKLKWIYDMFFGHRLLRDTSKIIALTHLEAWQYKVMGVPDRKITVIPNGIDLSEYTVLPSKGFFKKKFNIPDNKKIILYLGRIHKTKGVDLLIRAYAHLVKDMKCNDLVVVIAGPDDGHLHEVKSLASSLGVSASVLFTGFISSEDKLKALIDADVFVTPSFYGFPLTFLEACATGTPVVTTSLGGILEWIDGNVGYVTQPMPHDLAGAIYSIISDDNLHKQFSRKCMEVVKSVFSLEKVVAKIEEVYREVVER
jgi:glycosyltransferase involved in cell wall biosynthesis